MTALDYIGQKEAILQHMLHYILLSNMLLLPISAS